MDSKFEKELRCEDEKEVFVAKQKIEKYFKAYGKYEKDGAKFQLGFANSIMLTISESECRHPRIYCQIITDVFGNALKPECAPKYWINYVNNLTNFHYHLVSKKQYAMASQIYHYICEFPNSKLQNDNVCMTIVYLYCTHLHSLTKRPEALGELINVVENLKNIFEEMLERNKTHNFQYKDVLRKTMMYLFPNSTLARLNQLFSNLSRCKVADMLIALFKLNAKQRLPLPPMEEIREHCQYVIETLSKFFLFDVVDSFQSQLSLYLLECSCQDIRLQTQKSIAEIFLQLYEYLKLVCAKKPIEGFEAAVTKCCNRFKELFEMHSKNLMDHSWFKDVLVFLSTIHTQMQNTAVFANFWRQMTMISSYSALLNLLLDSMKLAPCISSETKLNTITCCQSLRKHVIINFANTALSTFVLYCQNVKDEPTEELVQNDLVLIDKQQATDGYSVLLQSPLLLITSHAFKVIDKMDCLSETSQEIQTLLYRFKQASVSACTGNQANTCIKIYEKFLKIKNKLPESEWPLLLKRLYKAVAKCMVKNPQIIRETQMCYIASLLQLPSEIDFCQIRGQITLYYRDSFTEEQKQNENGEDQICSTVPPHEHCLVHMLQHSTNTLRPHLKVARKRLLHWFEVQHIVKYYKTNTNLMKSVILCSQSFYDLVITTRATKLPTSDVPKFISIHKYLRDKLDLNRLEQLTYGHTCTKVLLEFQMSRSQKGSLESQEFAEDQLERLLMHKEMESLTICTELQYVKWAYDAYVAFEQFFLKFDEEQISSDEALIDWEAIIEDLGAVAQFLEMSSYTEYASHVWMLHYKISQLLLDDISSLKALTFFCENSSFYEENERDINLDKEIELHLPTITNSLENIESLHRRKQNLILLVTLHVGFYYIRCSKYTFGQMLLQYVEEKHNALPDRLGAYDLITANLDVIRYKLLWRHYHHAEKDLSSHVVKNVLLNQSLIGEIEQILERMKKFVCVASEALSYHKLIFNMVQDLAECSANRLYENVVISLYAAACKCALLNSFALRMAQVMSTWMHINLQMEYIDNAQTKLKIIEYIMGIKSLKELCGNSTPTTASTALKYCDKPSENISEAIPYNAVGMEATRRLVPVQLSPIKTGKLQLRPDAVNTNLKSYFKYKIDTKTLPNNELLGWTYFTIACLNARLYFLVEDYVQLEPFYEKGRQWIKMRENNFNKMYFKNVELMAVQHFANFLRASRQQKAAIECLEYGVDLCGTKKFDIDVVFRINFRLQMFEAQRELDRTKETKLPCDMFEKAWKYNMTPEKLIYNREKVKSSLKDQMMQLAMTSHKKNTAVSGSLSTRKNKTQTSRSSSSSPEVKDQLNERLNFRICEDSIEIIDSDSESGKYKSKEHYTPKIPRKTSKTSSTKKLSKQMNAQRYENQLSDSKGLQESTVFPTAPLKSSSIRGAAVSSSAAVENFKAKENIPHNDVDLLVRMKNLELSDKPKQKKGKIVLSKSPMDNKADTSVIMIEDSPIIRPVEMSASKPRGRPRKNKSVVTEVVKIVESTARPTRRRRNLVNENLELNCCPSSNEVLITSSSSSTSTPKITSSAIKTKKRQKI